MLFLSKTTGCVGYLHRSTNVSYADSTGNTFKGCFTGRTIHHANGIGAIWANNGPTHENDVRLYSYFSPTTNDIRVYLRSPYKIDYVDQYTNYNWSSSVFITILGNGNIFVMWAGTMNNDEYYARCFSPNQCR